MSLDPQNSLALRFFYFRVDGIVITLAYLLGSIPFGLLVSRARGVDIRRHGSGNMGATNVLRVLGKGPGYTVFALDAIKGLVAVILGKYIAAHQVIAITQTHTAGGAIYHDVFPHQTLPEAIAAISAAIACILGHNFPVWLRFKGGKGMATSAGVLIGMMPVTAASCLLIWFIAFKATRYVSLASIIAAIALPLVTMILLLVGWLHGWPYFYFAVLACVLAVWRHRSNILRLANGTENRFEKKPKPEAAA